MTVDESFDWLQAFNVRYGWVVVQTVEGNVPSPLIETVAATRSASLALLPGDPTLYAPRRRKGELACVRCRIMPIDG